MGSFTDNRKKDAECQGANAKHGVLPQPTGVAPGFRLFHGCSWFCSMWLTQGRSHDAARRTRLGPRRGKVPIYGVFRISSLRTAGLHLSSLLLL